PHIHQTAAGQFGPYAYRANAAQYFNLLWPVCLGFWWICAGARNPRDDVYRVSVCSKILASCERLARSAWGGPVCWRFRKDLHLPKAGASSVRSIRFAQFGDSDLLLACASIMAVAPIVSTSRGGALISVGLLSLAGLTLLPGYFRFVVRSPLEQRMRLPQ